MTFEEYIKNPMGKDNAVLNNISREAMRTVYTNKFDNILLRENNKITYYLAHDASNNIYWAYFKIPSETVKKFYYDVVVKFTADQKIKGAGRDLFKYNVRFYSNDPSFVFSYAYVFNKNDMFIPELSKKMSKEALKSKPKEKNKKELVGYVKTLYFAYLLMENRSLNKTSRFEAETLTMKEFFHHLKKIVPADDMIQNRQERGKGVSKRKKISIDQKTARRIEKITGNVINDERFKVAGTKKTSIISNTNSVKKNNKFGVRKSKRK